MNALSRTGRVLAALSTLGMCLLIANAITRLSTTTVWQWILLMALWLVPAAGIVFTERRRGRHRDP